MSKERELLRRISSHSESRIPLHFIKEIQQLLAQPEQTEQEPVAWMYEWTNEIGETVKGVYVGSHKASHLYELANLEPLYTAPQKREPLSDLDVFTLYEEAEYIGFLAYRKGIKDAEKAHGIGGEE